MIRRYKFKLVITLIVALVFNIYSIVKADNIDIEEYKDILVIASYSYSNDWENSIIRGIKDHYGDRSGVKIEYLDSSAYDSKEYYKDFCNLLNMKYKANDIKYIITLDDEAVDFVLTYLFDEDTVCYQKLIFCLGLNNVIKLNDAQKHYLNGIVDVQNGEEFLKFISSGTPDIKNLYLLLDESAYCEAFKKSIIDGNNKLNEKFNINYIKSNYIEDIEEEIRKLNLDSYAFILAGTFFYDDEQVEVSAESTIKSIQSISNKVIYATLEDYVSKGALGGLINDGYNLGKTGAAQLDNIIKNEMNYHSFYVVANLFDVCLVNYKTMKRYKVNPLNLPENTIYLEKGKYDLILPEYMISLIRIAIILICVSIIVLFYLLINNKKKERNAKEQLLQSKEREKIKTDFIILISHELRTPLNIILNTIKLLKLKVNNNEYEEGYFLEKIDYVIKNSNRLLKSINNSIDLAKIEAKVLNTNFKMENIVSVIDDVIDVTADFAKKYNVDVIFDPQEEDIEIAIDKEKIERIMLNLISNAIKSIKKKGCIFIKCSNENEKVKISVKDNGVGISEDDKEHVFEKFFQASSNVFNRENEGSGIGLYITKKLVEIHDGTIEIESEVGEGTTFYITLPIKIIDEENKSSYSIGKKIDELASLEFSDVINKDESFLE